MAYSRLHPNAIGTVITYLEMRRPPRAAPAGSDALSLIRWEKPSIEAYRPLFLEVGQHWLWFDALDVPEEALEAYLRHGSVEVHAVLDREGREVGLLELDFRTAGESRIAFLGLIPRLIGKGHGRWLLDQALRLAWRDGIARVHLNTCTLDHPAALAAYLRAGFKPYGRAVRTFFDPRLRGLLPREAAPHVPIIEDDGKEGERAAGSAQAKRASQNQRKKA